jgi:predicted PurR-regulated permease PerM
VIKEHTKIPLYARTTIILVGIFALVAILYIAQGIIVPLIFSVIIAIVLHPIVVFFVKRRFNRLLAIILAIVLASLLLIGITLLMASQISRLSDSWPLLVEKFTVVINESILWVSQYLDIEPSRVHEWIAKVQKDMANKNMAVIGQTLSTVGSGLIALFVIPVYIFLLLYYKPLIMEFIRRLFGPTNKSKVSKIVSQIKTVIQHYLVGLVIETLIIATLNTTVLLILGIEYAVLLGSIGALLNLIPYIGGLVAVALPMMVAMATKTSAWYPLYVLGLYYVVQLIDNNYIVPVIVASKVKINALFSIIVVFAGNALWGVSGMFLSIPLLAIIKLIFDQIEPLKPWGFLLGDNMSSSAILEIKPLIKKIIQKVK